MSDPVLAADAFADVVGQGPAVAALRSAAAAPVHAYLIVGPPGSGKRTLARGFAGEVLAAAAPAGGADRARDLARAGRHPDLVEIGAEGAAVRGTEAEAIITAALRSPVEGSRKVVVGRGFEAMTDKAAGMLLKTVEEPPESTIFVLLAEDVPSDLVTIASRCVRIDVPPLPTADVTEALVAAGASPERAAVAAQAAAGDLERARVLVDDERLELRRRAWVAAPDRLDGTGYAVHLVVDELLAMIDDAMAPLVQHQEAEVAALEAELEERGLSGKGTRKQLEDAHKRQLRRFRSGEVRFGLTLLARRERDRLVDGTAGREGLDHLDAIEALARNLRFNPNDRLALQVLFLRLGPG